MASWSMIGAIILPNTGGWAGSYYTRKSIRGWYEALNKPSWRPPNAAFAPVWTGLYCGMGFASYLVWRDGGGFNGIGQGPLVLYSAQLALNWAWTPIFFGAQNLKLALWEIIALDVSASLCTFAFFNINRTAGLLMLPYLGWLGLATGLTYVISRDNKSDPEKED